MTQTNTSKKDRKIIEELGTEKINYSNPYFNSLAKGSKVGENLPTRNCDDCGAALNPDDRFCSICGSEVQ